MMSNGYGLDGPYEWTAIDENTVTFDEFELKLEHEYGNLWNWELAWLPIGYDVEGEGGLCDSFELDTYGFEPKDLADLL